MGFGLCAVGYLFLFCFLFGGDIAGYVLIAVGAAKLSRYDKSFSYASFSAYALLPVGLYNLFAFLNTAYDFVSSSTLLTVSYVVNALYIFASLFMCTFIFTGVQNLAIKAGERSIAQKASFVKGLSLVYFAFSGIGSILGGAGVVGALTSLGKFLVLIVNTVFLIYCYASFTVRKGDPDDDE